MKKIFLICSLVLIVIQCFPANKPTICIIIDKSINIKKSKNDCFKNFIISAVKRKGYYRYVCSDRYFKYKAKLDRLYQRETNINKPITRKDAIRIAKWLGTKYLIFGKLMYTEGYYTINVFLLRTATNTRVRYTTYFKKRLQDLEPLAKIIACTFLPNGR